MSKSKIIYLPLDERPCNYTYPQYLSQISGIDMLTAPMDIMGRFKKPANTKALWDWLFSNAKDATHIVASMDLLLYGGIVPSRLHYLTKDECFEISSKLRQLKEKFPHLKIYAFQLITRAPARDGAGEEPDFYENHGYDIHRYGIVCDMEKLGVAQEEHLAEKEAILQRVPNEYLQDFITRRKTNFLSNTYTIDLAVDGIIDHLIIPLDDCKEYGYAADERKQLGRYLAEKNALSVVTMYPGADEIGCTLVARSVCDITGYSPKIKLDYNSNTGMLTIPSYEDRTIGETAPHHVINGGAKLAMSYDDCDVVMFIHPPTPFTLREEKELDRRLIHLECERNIPAFLQRLDWCLENNIPAFISDCAIPNGADKCLMQYLKEQDYLSKLTGYSGWNTSSNAMGTVMAHAIVYACARKCNLLKETQQQISDEFRLYRYLEDWGYMVEVRKTLTENLPQYGENLSFLCLQDKEPEIAEIATKMLQDFTLQTFKDCDFTPTVRMPWNRMFEVTLTLNKK